MNEAKCIAQAKKGFEMAFKEGNLYDKQTQDKKHLNQMIEALHIQEKDQILDLGTGTGYVAFELAKRYEQNTIIGLDIVEATLTENHKKAAVQNLQNLSFVAYDGITFPFEDETFDVIVSRYALHHFPNIAFTFSELARVLKKGGSLLIADPTPHVEDISRFVDAYMRMKPDGHIQYYTKDEFQELGSQVGLSLEKAFLTAITFPRLKQMPNEYVAILKEYGQEMKAIYHVYETEDGKYIYITQNVWNLAFIKK